MRSFIYDANYAFLCFHGFIQLAPILTRSQKSSMKVTMLIPMQRPSKPPIAEKKLIQV